MVGRALPKALQKKKARSALNSKLDRAAEAYKKERREAVGKPKGLRKYAADFGVSFKSLSRRVNGERTQEEYTASLQRLTPAQEEALVAFILESADRGLPLTQKQIYSHANTILQNIEGDGFRPLGSHWITAFHHRHADKLQTHWSKSLDTQRARALNPGATQAWFDLIKRYIVDEGILAEDIYGMDESGFPPSHQGKERVWGHRGTKTQHKQGGASRENVTALVTICADGSALQPMIIYKGKNFMSKWGDNNIAHATYESPLFMVHQKISLSF